MSDQQHYGLNMVVHAHSKRGKTWLAETTPAPRLVLDAEAGSRFTPSRKKYWNPNVEGPPEYDGSWDTTLVPVLQFRDVLNAYSWLNSGQHPFRSVVIDSVSEIQQRIIDDISGTNQMKTQDWGELLRKAVDFIRKFRDLVVNPVKPLDAVIYITMTKQRNDGVWIPYVQGQSSYSSSVLRRCLRLPRLRSTRRRECHPQALTSALFLDTRLVSASADDSAGM